MVWLLSLYIRNLWAIGLEARYFDLLAQAKDSKRVQAVHDEYGHLRVARKACRLQLHEREVPTACFEALHLEKRWRIGLPTQHKILAKLNDRCRTAQLLRTPGSLDMRFVSAECRERIAEAQRVQEYRQDSWYGD